MVYVYRPGWIKKQKWNQTILSQTHAAREVQPHTLPFGGFGVSNGANGFNFHLRLNTLGATPVMILSRPFDIADATCKKNCGLLAFGASIFAGSIATELYIGVGGCAVDSARIS